MKKKNKTKVIPLNKELVGIGFTEEQGNYLEAIKLGKETIEELIGRNMEGLTFSEMMKLRPITLEFTKKLAEKKITAENFENRKEELEALVLEVREKLRAVDMLRTDWM